MSVNKNLNNEVKSRGQYLVSSADFFRRVIGTFFHFRFLWKFVISDGHIERVLSNKLTSREIYVHRLFERMFWFWPRVLDARVWVGGDYKGRTADKYISFDVSSTVLCDAVQRFAGSKNSKILDLGCNVGRHLNNLHQRGMTNLHGVDAMSPALDMMADTFPETYAAVNLEHNLFQGFLSKEESNSFDIVYSHGATIQLVHPSFDVVQHLCRITREYVVLIHQETLQDQYPRFWHLEFEKNGFHLRHCLRPIGDHMGTENSNHFETNSLLVFQRHVP